MKGDEENNNNKQQDQQKIKKMRTAHQNNVKSTQEFVTITNLNYLFKLNKNMAWKKSN